MSTACPVQIETESIEECDVEHDDEDSEKLYEAGKNVQNQIYISLLPFIISKMNGESKEIYSTADIHCQNTIEFLNGNIYKGNIDQNFKLHGTGDFFWNDGSHYKGQFENNRLHGNGKLMTFKKDDYTGIFNYGVCHGRGRYQSKDLYYLGDFLNGKFHGQGLLETPSLTYEKDYPQPIDRVPIVCINPKPVTKRKILKVPSQYFEGEFSNDWMKEGIRKYSDGIFAGDFDKYGYRKYGKFKFRNGDKYFGSFAEDLCCDFGIYEWAYISEPDNYMIKNKEQYFYGPWSNGKRNGFGIEKFDERILFCIWNDFKKQGAGVIVAANGEVFVSTIMFDDNKYKEGWKLKINPITRNLMDILLNFRETKSLKESAILKGTKFDFCFSNEDYFKVLVNKFMNHILYKSEIFPMFIPNFALHMDLPCLFDAVRLILENNNNKEYPKNQRIKSFCVTKLIVDECCIPEDYQPPKQCNLSETNIPDTEIKKLDNEYFKYVSKGFLSDFFSKTDVLETKFPYIFQVQHLSPVISYASFNEFPDENVRKMVFSHHLKTDVEIREQLLKKYIPPDDNFAKMKRIYPNEVLTNEKIALLSARQLLEKELKSLNQVIFENLSKLHEIYLRYSTFNVENIFNKITDQICMQRIGLWLFYKDIFQSFNFPKFSITNCLNSFYDLYKVFTKDQSNPFDLVYFYEFLRHFLHIVFTLNENIIIRDYAIKESVSMYGLFSTQVLIFLREFHQTIEPFSGTLYLKKMIINDPNITRDLLKMIYEFDCNVDIDIRSVYKFYKHVQIENGIYLQYICEKKENLIENKLNLLNYTKVIENFYLDENTQIQYKNGLFLNCINDKNFIDCSKIIFPKFTKFNYIMLSELHVNILEYFDLILLLFDQEIINRDLLKKITHIS